MFNLKNEISTQLLFGHPANTNHPIPFQGEVLFPPPPPCDRRETRSSNYRQNGGKMDIFDTVPLKTNIKKDNTEH